MTSKRLHTIFVISLSLLLLGLLAGAYEINSLLTVKAAKLTGLKAKSQALAQEQISLNNAKKDIKKYAELEKITRAVVPEDKNQAEAVREIVKIADDNDIILGAINFPASTLGAGVTSPTGSAPATATPSPAASAKTAGLSQLQPVKNIPGVYLLLITVSSDANHPVQYSKFTSFLSALEHNRRTAQVSSITLQPDAKNRNLLNFNLILNEYIKP